jgi:hypothetical protein
VEVQLDLARYQQTIEGPVPSRILLSREERASPRSRGEMEEGGGRGGKDTTRKEIMVNRVIRGYCRQT